MSEHDAARSDKKVRVTARYPLTAAKKQFRADQDETLAEVVDQAYAKLGQQRRPGDRVLCHAESPAPREDLGPYFVETLRALADRGICVDGAGNGRGRLELELDIEAEAGGAA